MNRPNFYNGQQKNTAQSVYNVMKIEIQQQHVSKEEKQGVRYTVSMKDFGVYWVGGVCANTMGILWEFPQVLFLWVSDGYAYVN